MNDSYRGTLSSYCYVLMCIHLLQQRQPPILPCLQAIKPPTHFRHALDPILSMVFQHTRDIHPTIQNACCGVPLRIPWVIDIWVYHVCRIEILSILQDKRRAQLAPESEVEFAL